MKFIEMRGQIDLMTTMMLSQGMMSMIDTSLSEKERMVKNESCCLIAEMFCEESIYLSEHLGISMTPTMMAINEPGIRDGVYEYLFNDNKKPPIPPVMDSRIDGFCIYGSINPEKPKIEVYYGEDLIVSVDLMISGTQVVPNITNPGTKSGLSETTQLVIDGFNYGITRYHMSKIAGYKAGYEAGLGAAAAE